MPCVSGRAMHQLCRGDCPENACGCPVPTGFSCRPFCLCESRSDVQVHNQQINLGDARALLCQHIRDVYDVIGPYPTVEDFKIAICAEAPTGLGMGPPAFNCPLRIDLVGAGISGPTGAVGPFHVTTINKGICSEGDTDLLEAAYYDVSIDTIKCANFSNILGLDEIN